MENLTATIVYISQKGMSVLINTIQKRLDLHLPAKSVTFHTTDKVWITAEVKSVIHKRQLAFHQNNLPLWRYLRNKTTRLIKKAKSNYYNTRVRNLKENNPAAGIDRLKYSPIMTNA